MKNMLKRLTQNLIGLWSKIYSYNLNHRILGYKDTLYTMWLRNAFGKLPADTLICKPCSLQGGGSKRIIIGHHTIIEKNSVLGCWVQRGEQSFDPNFRIGNNCNIGEYNQITACNSICIGNGVLTGRYVYIGDNNHGELSWAEADTPPAKRPLKSKGGVKIGNNVWIGDKVAILGGVTIGDNVIIGANSVVTHDIPSNSVAAGIPARVVKELSNK